MWLTRDTTQPAIFPAQPDIPCAACGHSLRQPPAHWATWQELVKLNWDAAVSSTGAAWSGGIRDGSRMPSPPVDSKAARDDADENDAGDISA